MTGDDSVAVDIAPDGTIRYLPVFAGTEVVRYTVSDGALTTTGQLTISVTVLPSSTTRLYLTAPADTASTGTATTTAPGAGVPVTDIDGDGDPGLTVKSSNTQEDEDDVTKFQEWEYLVPSDLVLNGPVTLDLWTSLEDDDDADLDYAAWVYDCVARQLHAAHLDLQHPRRQLEHEAHVGAAHRHRRQPGRRRRCVRTQDPGPAGLRPQGRLDAARGRYGLEPQPHPVIVAAGAHSRGVRRS